MKKLCFILVFLLCFTLCGCPAAVPAPPETANVHITAGRIQPGMTLKDILVEVTIDHQPVACRVELTGFTATGYYTMTEDEPVPEEFLVRLDVFYSLPKGMDVDQIQVTMECDGGRYDGTGSIGDDDNGCVEAWSYAFYGEEEETPTEAPTEEPTEEPTEAPTEEPTEAPTEEPTEAPTEASTEAPTEAPTQPVHTHQWKENTSQGMSPGCTFQGKKVYSCSCGETKQENIDALGHDWNEPSVTKATCTQPGREVTTCKRCGEGRINELPATGHTWSAWTQKTGRVHERTCSCGATEEENHTIPSGSVTCTGCGADIIN